MVTLEEFINRANKTHNHKYDYSRVEYKKITDKVVIICPIHGEFYQVARDHYRGRGCPKCGIKKRSTSHTLSKEEFIKRAKEKFGETYDFDSIDYVNTKTKVKIYCPEHGVSYITPHEMFSHKYVCPKCGNKDKGKEKKLTTEEFIKRSSKTHDNKYDYSITEYVDQKTKVKIICPKHGVFETNPYSHMVGSKCPDCAAESRIIKTTKTTEWFIKKAQKVHGDKYNYSKSIYKNIFSPITITCPKHGDFEQIATYHVNGNGCPKCGAMLSKNENEIYEYCKALCNDAEQSNRKEIAPYEIDIYIPSKKIGIEYNGILWHSEEHKKDKNYHLKKLNLCKEKGIKLIQVFEDEYVNSKEIVLSKIRHLLGVEKHLPKIMGRKCKVSEISNSEAKEFLDKFHIQGYGTSTLHLGAFYEGELIAVMSFKKERADSKTWELTRFASDYNYICQGVGGKLFKHFVVNNEPDTIKSFADRRWTVDEKGNIYVKLGFDFDGYTTPDYKYFNPSDGIRRQHKFGFRKQKLSRKYNLPLSMTENEMTEKLGYKKIYDCGLIRYVWKKRED